MMDHIRASSEIVLRKNSLKKVDRAERMKVFSFLCISKMGKLYGTSATEGDFIIENNGKTVRR